MGIFFCGTEGCAGYFCSVDMSFRPHALHCEHYVAPQNAPEAPSQVEGV